MTAARTAISTLLALLSLTTAARTLQPRTDVEEFGQAVADSTAVADSVAVALPPFDPGAITLRGFNKRRSDRKETFFVQNNTPYRIAGVTLTLKYFNADDGKPLHERTVHVPCDLLPGASRQVQVASFDQQLLFYYYLAPKPRTSATPFKVTARLIGYDISITRPGNM